MGPDDALVKAFYASVTSDEALAQAIRLLADRFGCPSAVLMYVDPTRPDADIAVAYGPIDAEVQRRYREEYASLDPAPGAFAQMRIGSASTTDRLFSPETRAASRFYNEFYRPLGLVETMGGPIVNQDGRFGLLAVHRGADRSPFDDGDIQQFERLMHHVTQALELRRAFFEMEIQAAGLAATVDQASAGLMMFARSGRLTHANRAARRMIARSDGLLLSRAGRLMANDAGASRRLAALFAGTEGGLPVVLRVPRRNSPDHYTLRISRLDAQERVSARAQGGLLVAAHDPEVQAGESSALLALAFGLTLPAARLVAALLQGTSLETYARDQGLSLNTVKFHLKAAFAATGARRQADLVRIAGGLVRDLAQPEPAALRRPPLRVAGE